MTIKNETKIKCRQIHSCQKYSLHLHNNTYRIHRWFFGDNNMLVIHLWVYPTCQNIFFQNYFEKRQERLTKSKKRRVFFASF